jgi:hypothetical protein
MRLISWPISRHSKSRGQRFPRDVFSIHLAHKDVMVSWTWRKVIRPASPLRCRICISITFEKENEWSQNWWLWPTSSFPVVFRLVHVFIMGSDSSWNCLHEGESSFNEGKFFDFFTVFTNSLRSLSRSKITFLFSQIICSMHLIWLNYNLLINWKFRIDSFSKMHQRIKMSFHHRLSSGELWFWTICIIWFKWIPSSVEYLLVAIHPEYRIREIERLRKIFWRFLSSVWAKILSWWQFSTHSMITQPLQAMTNSRDCSM